MNLEELKQLLEVVRANELTEFELEQEGFKIRIRKDGSVPPPVQAAFPAAAPAAVPQQPSIVPAPSAPVQEDSDVELAIIKSPIVGTFYRAPQPGAPPFVELGQKVRKGQVLCIIEAMKLMNEIESEYDGTVAAIYVENAQPVQYGERLFAIRR